MKGLSQRGMNNVVIFAMLLMIALFNLNAFLPEKDKPARLPLLAQDAYVTKITQDQFALERIGQQWRQAGLTQPLTITPDEQYAAWMSAQLDIVDTPTDIDAPMVVVVWLAGRVNGEVYAFYPAVNQISTTYVKLGGQWYQLMGTELSQLLPWNE